METLHDKAQWLSRSYPSRCTRCANLTRDPGRGRDRLLPEACLQLLQLLPALLHHQSPPASAQAPADAAAAAAPAAAAAAPAAPAAAAAAAASAAAAA